VISNLTGVATRFARNPLACARSCGSSAWVSTNGAVTLMARTFSNPCSGNSPSDI
jgi:hypothetical protein